MRLIRLLAILFWSSFCTLHTEISIPLISFIPHVQTPSESTTQSIYEIVDLLPGNHPIATTLNINETVYSVQNSIPTLLTTPHETIFIYCAGWIGHFMGHRYRNKGVGILQAHQYIKQGILTGPTIAFDFQKDERHSFTFAQDTAIETVTTVIAAVVEKNPSARIVLVGDCRGGATILNFLTHSDSPHIDQIAGVMIECVPISLKRVARHIAKKFCLNLPGTYPLIHQLLTWALPSYQPENAKNIFNGHPFPAHIPILISNIDSDNLVSDTDITYIVNKIKQDGNTAVYRYTAPVTFWEKITKKTYHAKMCKIPAYQDVAHAFLQRHQFPHNPERAARGNTLIALQ